EAEAVRGVLGLVPRELLEDVHRFLQLPFLEKLGGGVLELPRIDEVLRHAGRGYRANPGLGRNLRMLRPSACAPRGQGLLLSAPSRRGRAVSVAARREHGRARGSGLRLLARLAAERLDLGALERTNVARAHPGDVHPAIIGPMEL